MARRFFFYGTLLAGNANAVARAVHRRLRPLGAASTMGRLLAIPDEGGWYPALVAGDGLVRGAVYEVLPDFPPEDLAMLDQYEGADYRRGAVRIEGFGEVEAYWWVAALPAGAESIAHGDFAGWLEATGRRAFGSA